MDVIIVFLVLFFLYVIQRNILMDRFHSVGIGYLDILLLSHLALFITYITYAYLTDSDSFAYYEVAVDSESWIELWGQQTNFIRFLTWPFANFLGLSYPSVMLIFSFMGFQGIVLCYLVAKENLPRLKILRWRYTILEFVFLLPNLHFWSNSIGKGSVMLLGVGLFIFGMSRFNKRIITLIIGALLIFYVRPHILYAFLLGTAGGVFFSSKGLNRISKLVFLALSLVLLYFIADDVSVLTGTDSINVFDSNPLAHRNAELSKSDSGIETGNNQLVKLFTFWYRPLFFDAPGLLGIIVSFENAIMLYFSIQLFRNGRATWKNMNTFYRIMLFGFLFGSVALAQVGGNLGIIMRQKSQIMALFYIVYCFSVAISQSSQRQFQLRAIS